MIGTAFSLFIVLAALSIPVAAVIGVTALLLGFIYSPFPLHLAAGDILWQAYSNQVLIAVPLFIVLGEIMLRAGFAEKMYSGIVPWLGWLPGGLMHANIGATTVFSATAGSSVATAATISAVAIPEAKRHKYNENLFLGSLAAGGTLGILIPPSIGFIVYGVLTNSSIPQLYLAGFLPGFALASLFSLTIFIACVIRPEWGGKRQSYSWRERICGLPSLGIPLLIFLAVVGSIYAGLATPTEAASLGVVASLVLTALVGRLSVRFVLEVIESALKTSAVIMIIVTTALFLSFVLGSIGLADIFRGIMMDLGLGPFVTLMLLVAGYIVLGMFMESFAMLMMTVPIVVPVVVALGYDPIWFGIFLTILIEISLITPPVGINLYVVQSVRGHGSLMDIVYGVLPFLIAMVAMLFILIAFPDLALYLPRLVYG